MKKDDVLWECSGSNKAYKSLIEKVKADIAQKLDWNLRDSEILNYRVTANWRLQVVLLDRCPRSHNATREYMERLTETANKHRIDLTVVHANPRRDAP